MKHLFTILTLCLAISLQAQNKPKEWIKKNKKGVVIEQGYHLKKKREGQWHFFYSDGRPSLKANYKGGLLHGESQRFDLQGNVIAILNYVNGVVEGKQTYFYPNGKVFSEGKMVDGKEEGAWKFYSQDGSFMGYVKYKNGKQLDEQTK